MINSRYRPGDSIVLKPRVLGSSQPNGAGTVKSVLPAAQGFVHYRVRFQNENYERSVRQDDIDVLASTSSPSEVVVASESSKSGWVNSNSIRIRK